MRTAPSCSTAGSVRRAAEQEGAVRIYGNTSLMAPMIEAFHRKHPKVRVTVEDMSSNLISERVVSEVDEDRPGSDLVWSTAMDAQIKLINDGYAQAYSSPHRRRMPPGSVWRDQGFGVTAEPVGFAYNRRLLPPEARPNSHAGLLKVLRERPDLFVGRVTAYDAERSNVAFMHLSADIQIYPEAWDLIEALGDTRPRLDTSGQRMMAQLAAGDMVLVHNVNLSFARTFLEDNPDLAVALPSDYHLTVSRVAFITANAPNPNAARLFLDFLLSREGQAHLAALGVRPVRDDVGATLRAPTAGERPVRVGPGLLANLDQERRRKILERWRRAMTEAPRAPSDPSEP
jgi:iron(III) transport system substrate-binding protein